MASVTVYFSGHEQGSYLLDKPMMVVGREATCQIYLDNRSISRQHCAFVFKDNDFLIQDLSSANGTYVNGQRITEQRLKHGDEIIIGNYELRYHSASSVAVPPMAAAAAGVDESANTLDDHALRKAVAAVAAAPAVKPSPVQVEIKNSDMWYYAENNRQAGPVDTGTLKRLIRANVVTRSTLVWKDGMANWSPAADVPHLVAEPPPLPPAPPAPKQPPPLPVAAPPAAMTVPSSQPMTVPESHPLVGLPKNAQLSQNPVPQPAPFDTALFASLGRYLLVWGIALLITGCWEAWSVIRLGPQVGNHVIFFGYVAIVIASMACAIFSLFAGATFTGLSTLKTSDVPALMQALWSIKRVHLTQCVLAILLLAMLILPSFLNH